MIWQGLDQNSLKLSFAIKKILKKAFQLRTFANILLKKNYPSLKKN